MQRKGMMVGSGKSGYYNITGRDPMVHSLSARGIKQPQRMLNVGTPVKARFTQAKGQVISKQPFAVKYQHKGDKYVRFSNPKYWEKGGKTISVKTKVVKGNLRNYNEMIAKGYFVLDSGDGMIRFAKKIKGGKDMPVTEVEDVLTKLDEPKSTPKKYNGEKLKKAASGAYSYLKERAKEAEKYLAERKATKKARELSTDVENKGLSTAYLAQKARVDTLKQQIAERRAEGRNVDDLITELGKEEKDYREIQEKVSDVSTKAMSDGQLRELAVRTSDESLFSLGGGNQYEKELLRRIAKRKELQQKVEKAEKEPVKSGSIFDI